jgi:hypothetical protein
MFVFFFHLEIIITYNGIYDDTFFIVMNLDDGLLTQI